MVSLQDVSKLAGVSKSLVSRVINGQSGVSPASRQKIQDAMAQLLYSPNALARLLVLRSTKTIGVVMDSLCEEYFFPLISGLENGADNTEFDVIYSHGRSQAAQKKKLCGASCRAGRTASSYTAAAWRTNPSSAC